ncbi:hypothetical protein KIL84_007146, partial [Mauremys mutica]
WNLTDEGTLGAQQRKHHHQIKRQTGSKEDIFREVLQSSDHAVSEHRARRETINEKLKMESQERRQGQERM